MAAALALALGPQALANVVGADTQNFNPTTSGLDFVTVQSSETLRPGFLNLGLFLNYAVNSLPNYEDITSQSRTNFSDALFSADLNMGLGIGRHWDVGLSLPYLIAQSVDSDLTSFRGEFANTGLTEVRVNSKYRLYGNNDHGVAVVGSANFNMIQNNPFAGDGAGPTYSLEFVGDRQFGPVAVAVNGGYRFRNPGRQLTGIPVEPLGDQWIASTAASYLLPNFDIKLIGELFGALPVNKSQFSSDRELSSLEALIGLKMDLTPALAWHAGGGTEVLHGTSSPDWRIYTGVNWVMGPLFAQRKELIVRINRADLEGLGEESDPYDFPPSETEEFVARDVLFEFDSDNLHPDFLRSIKSFVEYISRPPGFKKMIIEGHTDSIGSTDYNQRLSERRAQSVRAAMIKAGMPADRLEAIGYGETHPIADNGNFQGRGINRRVEFKLQR